ncbi:MAG: hypothetical protein ABL888_21545 [Pirellulaceae bacterium]
MRRVPKLGLEPEEIEWSELYQPLPELSRLSIPAASNHTDLNWELSLAVRTSSGAGAFSGNIPDWGFERRLESALLLAMQD